MSLRNGNYGERTKKGGVDGHGFLQEATMKLNVLTLALAASAFTVLSANAQVTIEERRDPAVVIEHDEPSVTVEERHRVVPEKRVIERRTPDRLTATPRSSTRKARPA